MSDNASAPKPFGGPPEIPLAVCPHCNGGYLAIKSVTPRLIGRAVNVEFVCPTCETVVAAKIG